MRNPVTIACPKEDAVYGTVPVSEEPKSSSLGHFPGAAWEFDDTVTAVFEDMLARSIPQIEGMREIVFQTSVRAIAPGTDIVDLGCSRGDAIAPLIERFRSTNRFVGIDASIPMVNACRARFRDLIDCGVVEILCDDLRNTYPPVNASLTLCVLTLQFTPLQYRLRMLKEAFARTIQGGAFILVEKIIGSDENTNELLIDLYYSHKRAMGYSQEEIDRKRLSLEGILVPMSSAWNEQMLRSAGFEHVECLWRALNFCGWVAIKG